MIEMRRTRADAAAGRARAAPTTSVRTIRRTCDERNAGQTSCLRLDAPEIRHRVNHAHELGSPHAGNDLHRGQLRWSARGVLDPEVDSDRLSVAVACRSTEACPGAVAVIAARVVDETTADAAPGAVVRTLGAVGVEQHGQAHVLDGNDVLIYAAGVGTLKDHGISVEEALASDDEFFQMVASTEA